MTPTKKPVSEIEPTKADILHQDDKVSPDIIDQVIIETEKTSTVHGIVIGKLTGFNESHLPCVNFFLNPTGHSLPSRSTVELFEQHIGQDVALMFEMNDVRKPIILGLMHVPVIRIAEGPSEDMKVITADKEILIRCGESSIHMRKDGKIEIKGNEILSMARCGNKIKGGMVGLN